MSLRKSAGSFTLSAIRGPRLQGPRTFDRYAFAVALVLGLVPSPARAADDRRQPLTLPEAYAQARAHAPELLSARERIVQAENNVQRAWALLKPNLSASFSFTHIEPKPVDLFRNFPDLSGLSSAARTFSSDAVAQACPVGPDGKVPASALLDCASTVLGGLAARPAGTAAGTTAFPQFALQDTATFNARATWNVLNGRALPLLQNAYETVDLEKAQVRGQERVLLLAVARAFYAAAATEEALVSAKRGLALSQARAAVERQRAATGDEPPARLRAAEIAIRQADLDVRRAANAHAQGMIAVAILIGGEEPSEVIPPPDPEVPVGSEEELIARAVDRRDDLRAARSTLAIAERAHDEVWWRFAPTIALFGGFRYSNVAGLTGQNYEGSVGLLASLDIYDGGLRYTDLADADSRIRIARLALEGLVARVRQEVRQSRLRLEASGLGIERAREALGLARERLAVTTTEHQAGAARDLELREATDSTADAERLLIRESLDRAVGVLELQQATGTFEP